eukprot:XP_005635410.1 uncharacterized protein LOC102153863 [Canis lupus familiaris]
MGNQACPEFRGSGEGGAPPPRGFLRLGRPGAGEAGPSRRGRGAIGAGGRGRGARLAGCGVRARWPPAARRGAPARRALHSPSLHQRLREEGRDPSLAHFPPSQTRTLPRSRSLTPSLPRSLAHTHARTRRRGSPSRARSPSGSSGRPPGSGLARPPAARSVPRRQDRGQPRAAPRGPGRDGPQPSRDRRGPDQHPCLCAGTMAHTGLGLGSRQGAAC